MGNLPQAALALVSVALAVRMAAGESAPRDTAFRALSGDCAIEGDCAASFPVHLFRGDYCSIGVLRGGTIDSPYFSTSIVGDGLLVGDHVYSGNLGPRHVPVRRGDVIRWSSEPLVVTSGWKICIHEQGGAAAETQDLRREAGAIRRESKGLRREEGEVHHEEEKMRGRLSEILRLRRQDADTHREVSESQGNLTRDAVELADASSELVALWCVVGVLTVAIAIVGVNSFCSPRLAWRGVPPSSAATEPLLRQASASQEPCSLFAPSTSVFDYWDSRGRQVRCVRVEARGRNVTERRCPVLSSVKVLSTADGLGTDLHVRLHKESDMPGDVAMPGVADIYGFWEKTFEFRDGLWELREPECPEGAAVDAHGILQVRLVRTTPLLASELPVGPGLPWLEPVLDFDDTTAGGAPDDVEDEGETASTAVGTGDVTGATPETSLTLGLGSAAAGLCGESDDGVPGSARSGQETEVESDSGAGSFVMPDV